MIEFMNQFPCTAKIMKENLFDKHNRKIRPFYILWVILMFLSVIRFALSKNILWLLITVVFIVLMALTVRYKNIYVIKEWKKIRRVYAQGFPYIVVELGEVIAYTVSNRTRIYSWKDFDYFVETDRLIIMSMKDGSRILLKKNGFTTGTYQECIQMLQKKLKSTAPSKKR